jgi:hypothetical protein
MPSSAKCSLFGRAGHARSGRRLRLPASRTTFRTSGFRVTRMSRLGSFSSAEPCCRRNRIVDDFVDAKAPAIQELQTTSTSSQQLARYQWLTKCREIIELKRMRNRVRDQRVDPKEVL